MGLLLLNSSIYSSADADADRTYVQAHINRAGAGNGVVDLEFSGSISASNYQTGITLQCREPAGTWQTLDPAKYTSALQDSKYIRNTLTGTVDTFQASHEFRASFDGSGDLNVTPFTADATLTNSSSIDLLALFIHGYNMEEASGTRFDAIGSLDFTDNNSTARATGKVGFAADFEESLNNYMNHVNHADFQTDLTKAYGVFCWASLESKRLGSEDAYIIGKNQSTKWEWNLAFEGTTSLDRFRFFISTQNAASHDFAVANSFGSPALSTFYCIMGWYDPASNKVKISINNGPVDSTARTITPTAGTSDIQIGTVNNTTAHQWDGLIDALYWFKSTAEPTSLERTDFYNSGSGKQYPFIPDHL